jgi:hypothetical protein
LDFEEFLDGFKWKMEKKGVLHGIKGSRNDFLVSTGEDESKALLACLLFLGAGLAS